MLWVKLLALHWNRQKCSLIPAPYHLSIANYCLSVWFASRQSAAVYGACLGKWNLPGRSKTRNPCKSLNSHGPVRELQCSVRQNSSKTEYTEYRWVVGSNLYITSNYFVFEKALESAPWDCSLAVWQLWLSSAEMQSSSWTSRWHRASPFVTFQEHRAKWCLCVG